MTRRRFQHCQNETCNRRLEVLPPESEPQPAPTWCPACFAMQIQGDGTGSVLGYQAGHRAGFWWGLAAGVVGMLVSFVLLGLAGGARLLWF